VRDGIHPLNLITYNSIDGNRWFIGVQRRQIGVSCEQTFYLHLSFPYLGEMEAPRSGIKVGLSTEFALSFNAVNSMVIHHFYAIIIILRLTVSLEGLPCMRVHCCKWACITVQLHSSAVWCACVLCDVHACRALPCRDRRALPVQWPCMSVMTVWCPCSTVSWPCHWVCSLVNVPLNIRGEAGSVRYDLTCTVCPFWCDNVFCAVTLKYPWCFGSIGPRTEIKGLIEIYSDVECIHHKFGP